MVQNWDTLMRAFMMEYYSPGKTQSLRNKITTFAQYPTETISEAFECLMSTLRRFHITSSRRRISFKGSTKDSPWHQGRSSLHRWEDLSSSIRRLKLLLYSRRSRTMTRRRRPDVYFRFNPWGTSKESCKWRRKHTRRQDRFIYAEVGEDGDRKERGSRLNVTPQVFN
jgi:hypothetical protein